MMCFGKKFLLCVLITLVPLIASCAQQEPLQSNRQRLHNSPGGETMTLPVSVYSLSFSDNKELNAQYSHEDVMALFKEVNEIWAKYGVFWQVDSFARVQVSGRDIVFPDTGFATPREFRDAMAGLIPDTSGKQWRVYLVKQFPVNGSAVYLIEKGAILYGELNKHGERHPVILAHELGHSLGLRHVSSLDNLMYAGPDRNPALTLKLTPGQVKHAKEQAMTGPLRKQPGARNQKIRKPARY